MHYDHYLHGTITEVERSSLQGIHVQKYVLHIKRCFGTIVYIFTVIQTICYSTLTVIEFWKHVLFCYLDLIMTHLIKAFLEVDSFIKHCGKDFSAKVQFVPN